MSRPSTELTVTATEVLTPGMIRLRFSGNLAAFAESADTDRYVKLCFNDQGGTDISGLGESDRPVLRTFTALEPDVDAGTLNIDFVLHGDRGIAGPWARKAKPGDTIRCLGPGGGYAPAPDAAWHLIAGDESALPAIRQAVQALPATARGYVVVAVPSSEHEQPVVVPDGVELLWLHQEAADHPGLADAVKALGWLDGTPQVFVHGEAGEVMQQARPYLLRQRGIPRQEASISAYWRRGNVDEEFRAWKREFAAAEAAKS